MVTRTGANESGAAPIRSASFEKFAGVCAVLTGVLGFLFAVAFVVLRNELLSALFLMLGGLLTTAASVWRSRS